MDKNFCSYHYKTPATFECHACKRFYGDCCIRQQLIKHTCPLCHRQLTFLGAANTAPPFWEQMSNFFRYPLQAAPLGLLAISAAMFSLVEPNVLGLVIVVVFACVLTKYAYSIIQASKDGQTRAPSIQSAFSSENLNVFFKQLAVLVLASLAMIPVALTDSAILIFLASTIINMLIPASIIVLALTNEVLAAMNPAMLFSIVKAVGWRYILLCLFLFFLSQGPSIMVGMLTGSNLSIPVLVLIFGYFSLVMCRLLGYTVYQSQAELGFVSDENEIDCNLSEDDLADMKASQSISTVEIYIKEGRYEDARNAL